jgi:beta-alanine--pyruvate transaminase
MPDMITVAKGLTNGAVPMGAVFVRKNIYDAFMQGPESSIEFFHGYTYSGHPLACAAARATLDVYSEEGLFQRAAELSPFWEEAVHSLRGLPHVIDVRNLGLVAGIELEPIAAKPTARAYDVFLRCYQKGVMVRFTGDTLALSPPLIVERSQITEIVDSLAAALKETA